MFLTILFCRGCLKSLGYTQKIRQRFQQLLNPFGHYCRKNATLIVGRGALAAHSKFYIVKYLQCLSLAQCGNPNLLATIW